MAAITKENLDERIERIKKRNEEIEKKYREAEEDRLMALKDNAMVETKSPNDEYWPKGHKYDKIDFTYDVKPEKLEEGKYKKQEEIKSRRDFKKFPDGEGPPPDPAYNFLADAERDGILIAKNENKNEKKDVRQNNKNKDLNKRNGPNNNNFCGRGGKIHNSKYQKQNCHPEYEQWRSEREKIDEARINRQKNGEGKWRREWDSDKINSENEALLRSERAALGDDVITKKSPTYSLYSGNKLNTGAGDCLIERRGNITVSVSQTGEVKSVKLTSAPVIGTGRVGLRSVSKPQFSVQAVEREIPTFEVPISPKLHNKDHNKNSNIQHKNSSQNLNQNTQHKSHNPSVNVNIQKIIGYKTPVSTNIVQQVVTTAAPNTVTCPASPIIKKLKPQNPNYIPPQNGIGVDIVASLIDELPISSANGVVPVDLSHKPEFAKRSVQERLFRVKQTTRNDEHKLNSDQNDQNPLSDKKLEERFDNQEKNCDRTNESNQSIDPIATCN